MAADPIIIRKKRVSKGDGHHGGAWKVAYADFVTAMMAFFLLMWLLNATTEEQRKGIADYFDPSVPLSPVSGGGTDVLSGDTVHSTDALSSDNHGGQASDYPDENRLVTEIEQSLADVVDDDQFSVTLSDEGIVVELMEADDAPLFTLGKATASPLLGAALDKMTPILAEKNRPIKIVGHTDALPYRKGARYTNWELSADRANVARRLLIARGLKPDLLSEVVGRADRMPLVEDGRAPQNRRISIILLNENRIASPPLDTH